MRRHATNDDRCFCRRQLPRVSRTFALSIEALPENLREAVRVSYLLCRVVDSIEDATALRPDHRAELFDAFDRLLADDTAPTAELEVMWRGFSPRVEDYEQELCLRSGAAFRVFTALPARQRQAIRPHVQEMSAGMREYVQRGEAAGRLRIHDLDDLERYCHFVAGTVGGLLTDLFRQHVPLRDPVVRRAIEDRSESFGLGLQLVNIVKDVAEDATRGICFMPRSLAEEHGVSLEHLLDPSCRAGALALVHDVCARARHHLRAAEEYTALWPVPEGEPVRLFCIVPLVLALATLSEVEAGHDTLTPGATPKVGKLTVLKVLADARRAMSGNEALDRMLGQYHPTVGRPVVVEGSSLHTTH